MPVRSPSILAIYISPKHNFFGHFGKAPSTHPTSSVGSVECVGGKGLRGDRFFHHREDYRGQVTFFAQEIFEILCCDLGITDKDPSVFRRNVLTAGLDLPGLIGKSFSLQGVPFFGTEEAKPCAWMESAFAPGAQSKMEGQGGLRARILKDGCLRVGPADFSLGP